MIDDVRYMI